MSCLGDFGAGCATERVGPPPFLSCFSFSQPSAWRVHQIYETRSESRNLVTPGHQIYAPCKCRRAGGHRAVTRLTSA